MKIGLLSGAYPPSVDGIGDYTHLLARSLSEKHEVTVFTARQQVFAPSDKVSVRGIFEPSRPATIQSLTQAIGDQGGLDRLVVQYNPFGYGSRGFNPWLPITLTRLRKMLHLSLMFHETYVPCESAAQFGMRLWQIPQFFFLSRMSDSLFSSCNRWLPAIRRATGREAVQLPVGSNISLSRFARGEARAGLGIETPTLVLGVFGSAHPSRLLNWISQAANRLHGRVPDVLLIYIGADGEKVRASLGPEIRMPDCGLLPSESVGDHLMAADIVLAPFVDGLSTRRGSVAAAFQHGIPVISTSSVWTDAMLLDQEDRLIFLSPVEDGAEAFSLMALRVSEQLPFAASRQTALRHYYGQEFGWNVVSRKVTGG